MEELRTRVAKDGRIVIPVAARQALGILPGDALFLRVEDDELRITTMRHRIREAQQLVRRYIKSGTSLVDSLLAERRKLELPVKQRMGDQLRRN